MNTSSITQLTEDCIAVVVPQDASDFKTHYSTHHTNDDVEKLVFSSEIQDPLKCGGDMLHLPAGQWEILGKGDSLTEEQWVWVATQVVGWSSVIYHNHTASGRDYRDIVEAAFSTATESGLSLLKSKGLKPENTLILKRKA